MKSMIKKIIASYPFHEKRHSLFDPVLALLSEKYHFVYTPKTPNSKSLFFKLTKNPALKIFYHKHIRGYFSLGDIKSFFSKTDGSDLLPYDLIFATGTIPPFPNNYIIDFENVTALGGYDLNRINKRKVEEYFGRENCRAVFVYNENAKDSVVSTLNCERFIEKIAAIPFGMKSDKIYKKEHTTANLLFVGSVNNPMDFELKGGIIALETYAKLVQHYPHVRMTIRSYVPPQIKKRYGSLPGLTFVEHFLSPENMRNLFLDSDILLQPWPGVNLVLNCMNFELPIVAFDALMMPEMVFNGKTGFLVDSSSIFGDKTNVAQYFKELHLSFLKMYAKNVDLNVVVDHAEKTSVLIENKLLRRKMGRQAKMLLEPGEKYNLEKSNKAILKLIESSLQ